MTYTAELENYINEILSACATSRDRIEETIEYYQASCTTAMINYHIRYLACETLVLAAFCNRLEDLLGLEENSIKLTFATLIGATQGGYQRTYFNITHTTWDAAHTICIVIPYSDASLDTESKIVDKLLASRWHASIILGLDEYTLKELYQAIKRLYDSGGKL